MLWLREKSKRLGEKGIFDKLFEPIQIRGMELKNRVMMSAIGTHESVENKIGIRLNFKGRVIRIV